MIVDRLRDYFTSEHGARVAAAYLFGSVAAGRKHAESDVDVGVLAGRDRYPSERARSELRLRLANELMTAAAANDVDVVILEDAPPELGRRIIDGVRLYVADAEATHAFERDVQLRAADLAPFLERMRRIKLRQLMR